MAKAVFQVEPAKAEKRLENGLFSGTQKIQKKSVDTLRGSLYFISRFAG